MFEIMINEYWVKPIIIKSYSHCIELERFFDAVSKFRFKEKYVIKRQNDRIRETYDTSMVILIGEINKRELKRKYKELKGMNTGIELNPYVIEKYPLNFDKCKFPEPYFCLEKDVVRMMEDITLN